MLLDKIKMEFLGSFFITYFITCSAITYSIGENSLISHAICTLFIYSVLSWLAIPISGA